MKSLKVSRCDTLDLATRLLAVPSISPDLSTVQDILCKELEAIGFHVESLERKGCRNLWARIGSEGPLLVFSGHSDVVEPGDSALWTTPPFVPTARDGQLFARGAADMKGAIAAMVSATARFLNRNATALPFAIGFLITGDEEIGGAAGEATLAEILATGTKIDYCIVGEPTSRDCLGDFLKIGRRGSMSGSLSVRGRQGHVGYPHVAVNAIHQALAPMIALSQEKWDAGGKHFEPSSFQFTAVNAGIAANVIPGELEADFNFRFSPYITTDRIRARFEEICRSFSSLEFETTWDVYAEPFLTEPKFLTELVSAVVERTLGKKPSVSTSGGTSDARFFAKQGIEVVELGPRNTSIHQVNESVSISDLEKLSGLYESVLLELMQRETR